MMEGDIIDDGFVCYSPLRPHKHKHNFVAKRPNATVLVCSCGKFQHVVTKDTVIVTEKR